MSKLKQLDAHQKLEGLANNEQYAGVLLPLFREEAWISILGAEEGDTKHATCNLGFEYLKSMTGLVCRATDK